METQRYPQSEADLSQGGTLYWLEHEWKDTGGNVAFSEDRSVAVIYDYGQVLVYSLKTGEKLLHMERGEMPEGAESFSLSPDGLKLAVISKIGTIVIYEIPQEPKPAHAVKRQVWDTVDALDILDCDFRNAELSGSGDFLRRLRMNGALVNFEENLMQNSN